MRQRGRKSIGALTAANGDPPRLAPPDFLNPDERTLFEQLVASVAADHFQSTDVSLLVSFVQATLLAQSTAGRPEQFETWEKTVRVQIALAAKLRLSPQSRTDPKTLARHPPLQIRRPWEKDPDDDFIERGKPS